MHTWRRPDVLQHKHVLIMDAAIDLPLLLNVGVIILDTDTLGLKQPRYRRELCGTRYRGLRRWVRTYVHVTSFPLIPFHI